MSVSLKFTFDNINEAQAFLAGKIAGTPTQPVAVPAVPPPGEGAVSTGTEKAADGAAGGTGRGRRGKKTESGASDAGVASADAGNAAAAPAATESAPTPAGTPPAVEQPKLTEAEVRAALLKVSDKFGAEGFSKVAEVLAPFGIQKVKDIKPEQFAEVIAAAEKLTA